MNRGFQSFCFFVLACNKSDVSTMFLRKAAGVTRFWYFFLQRGINKKRGLSASFPSIRSIY